MVNKSYESFITELLNKKQHPLALTQSSMFPQNASTAGYHPSYTPQEAFEQTALSSQELWRIIGLDRHVVGFSTGAVQKVGLFSELGCYVHGSERKILLYTHFNACFGVVTILTQFGAMGSARPI